ncbi:MAG: hypothetical protein ACI4WT_02440 [Oligosphaeraceae bacterium]
MTTTERKRWGRRCGVWLLAALTLATLAGCASAPRQAEALRTPGRWMFVYYETAQVARAQMPPPFFDALRFLPDGRAAIVRAFGELPMTVPCEVASDGTALFRLPTPQGRPIVLRCQTRLADGGRILTLRDRGTAAVFIPEDALEPGEALRGRWRGVGANGVPVELLLSADGSARFGGVDGCWHRLWRSGSGRMLSLMWPETRRGQGGTLVWQVRLSADGKGQLELTPQGGGLRLALRRAEPAATRGGEAR